MFNSIVNKPVAAVAVFLLGSGVANATVDPAVTTAISSAGTDAGTVGSAALVVLVGIMSFKWIRKAL